MLFTIILLINIIYGKEMHENPSEHDIIRRLLAADIDEKCVIHEDCEGYGLGSNDIACCDGTCQQKLKDYAGIGYCPDECVAAFMCKSGTCPTNRGIGESCSMGLQWGSWGSYVAKCPGQCSSGCCENGKCVSKQKDWLGVYYCPAQCNAGSQCIDGTCPGNRSAGSSCVCIGQCSSGCCESGKCVSKQKDWLGVYYCPAECSAGAGCGSGTCPKNRSTGSSCSCRNQCSSGCCEGGKCVSKKKDWAGVYYCPAECRGGAWKGAGTC